MAITTTILRFVRRPAFLSIGLILVCSGSNPQGVSAQSLGGQANPPIIRSTDSQFSTIVLGPIPPSPAPLAAQVGRSGAGLTILPTFNSTGATAIDAATQTVINNAIAFYQNTFTNNITVNIEFHNMSSGLGQSIAFIFPVPYSTYCSALAASATSPDDMTAVADTPCGSTNPVNSTGNIDVKSPSGRVLGINTSEQNFGGSCPTGNFTGSGCIGLNVSLANMHPGLLFATVEHEIDEVLGLGSALNGTTTPTDPWPEDLFRWHGASTRSYAANTSTTNPCGGGTPAAFFSIDGGTTNLDDFNNCNNSGDYGDWITHSPPQVQDAFINISGTPPSLTTSSSEVRALDVIGYSIASSAKHRRGQVTSE